MKVFYNRRKVLNYLQFEYEMSFVLFPKKNFIFQIKKYILKLIKNYFLLMFKTL
jgi:hypothetical protein